MAASRCSINVSCFNFSARNASISCSGRVNSCDPGEVRMEARAAFARRMGTGTLTGITGRTVSRKNQAGWEICVTKSWLHWCGLQGQRREVGRKVLRDAQDAQESLTYQENA